MDIAKCCRCRHMEVSHDDLGCHWCKCKCFKFDRGQSVVAHNAAAAYRLGNSLPAGLFADEDKTA